MKSIANKTQKPLSVPLPRGKTLHLGPEGLDRSPRRPPNIRRSRSSSTPVRSSSSTTALRRSGEPGAAARAARRFTATQRTAEVAAAATAE